MLLGILVLLGWATDAGLLVRLAPSLPAAMPNSALMFFACGVALAIDGGALERSRRTSAASLGCKLFVVALAGATLVEHVSDTSLGIDNPYGIDFTTEHPGRPATHTAAAFLMLGTCLLASRARGRLGGALAGVLGAGTAAVVGLAVAGYLVGVPYLQGSAAEHGMSVHTAFGLVVVVTGVFALRPELPPASWYAYSGGGEAAARRLMGPALVLPFAVGALVQGGASLDLYSERFGLSLMVVVVAALIQAMIYRAVSTVRAYEAVQDELERESRKNVQRFTSLTAEAPVGIFESDPSGNMVFVNERWREITGLSGIEALASHSPIHPEDRDRIRAEWRAAAVAGRDYDAEMRFQRPGGEVRWVSVHATALRDERGEVTSHLGSVLDITDRRAAEERTALVVDRIAEAVTIIGPDGRHVHVNDAGRAILDDLRQRHEEGSVGDLPWDAVDEDAKPIANADLPAEVTRTTGREIDEQVVGFPGARGDLRWLRISTRRLSAEGPPYSVVASFVDVTAQREAADHLAEAQARFELAFERAPIGVCLVSLDGRLLRVNEALSRMFGYSKDELLGATFQELTEPDDLDVDLAQLGSMLQGEIGSYEMQKRYQHKDGSQVWALVTVALARTEDHKPLYFIAQIMDITERRRLEEQLRHQAEHDTLTCLFNRRAFGRELAAQLARERRYGGESSLLMVDLDGFKAVNDTFGHAVGDELLQAVGETLAQRVRDTDVVARLGGDEFAVLLPSTARNGAEVVAIDVVQSLREIRVHDEVAVTASIGIASTAELPAEADTDTLLAAADAAMYEAKKSGRDGYAVHRSVAR